MTSERPDSRPTIKELAMRYTPAALAIALLATVTSSAGFSAVQDPDPRAAQLVAEGRAALDAGDVDGATDAFEAALAIDPAYSTIYLELAHRDVIPLATIDTELAHAARAENLPPIGAAT